MTARNLPHDSKGGCSDIKVEERLWLDMQAAATPSSVPSSSRTPTGWHPRQGHAGYPIMQQVQAGTVIRELTPGPVRPGWRLSRYRRQIKGSKLASLGRDVVSSFGAAPKRIGLVMALRPSSARSAAIQRACVKDCVYTVVID